MDRGQERGREREGERVREGGGGERVRGEGGVRGSERKKCQRQKDTEIETGLERKQSPFIWTDSII